MSRYADIIIDISHAQLDHPFTYRIPEELADQIGPGTLVDIPFGQGNAQRSGYVVALKDSCAYPEEKVKTILGLSGKQSAGTEDAVRLAAWMSRNYGSTMITALKTVLSARRKVKPIEKKEILLLLSEEALTEQLAFYERRHQVARHRLLKALSETPEIPYELVTGKLHVPPQTIRAMKEQGIIEIRSTHLLRNPVSLQVREDQRKQLSDAQQAVVNGFLSDFDRINAMEGGNAAEGAEPVPVSLLHGITGSGKTEVYIAVIEGIIRRGRQAIMLIPEIALTYQTLIRFYRHFGDRVSVMNSSLSEGEKSDQMERARRGEIDVIIGPRSALFTPFPNPGIIVIDEEHEGSYKNESMPKYHARETAVEIARLHRGVVLLGSATPSLESYYRTETGEYRRYEMSERLTGGCLPEVEVADLREELRNGNRSILSVRLKTQLDQTLERGEQAMLFLNRRGFSGFVSCRSCGEVIKCPHCDVSLSLHKNGRLVCHYCGHEEPAPKICPSCGSSYISGFRAGTEQVEDFLKKEYPSARILRMDADSTARKGDYERILSAFANEEADILIGTQMIVKGHDFPKVTLVGILLADMSLYAGDYRAAERTFQLLTQAAGRAGRGEQPGHVVIQTYQPEHYSIVYAAQQDYQGFYREEIGYREVLSYPPAAHMLAVQVLSDSEDEALGTAGDLRGLVREDPALTVIGPAAASYGRLKDLYRFAVYIKSGNYDKLVACKDVMEQALMALQETPGRRTSMVQFDFDPVSPF
ncbi:MAG: primosomal protein N' [Lachnospiraceae bacterium]|nr:primosomal protein N' [Lachnospiraceae bacterium]